MQTKKMQLAVPILFLVSLGMMGCTMGSGLFTEEELGNMYQIVVSKDGTALDSGARISTTTKLGLSIEGIDGAPEADSVELLLSYPDGTLAASILFSTAETNAPESIVVKDFEKDVPPFTMPKNLPDGYYILQLQIKNATEGILSKHSTAVLLYEGVIPTPSLAVYPGSVIAGDVSLIRLEADFPEAIDPWIRWTIDGKVMTAGLDSDHADRLAWRAPTTSGVYLAKAEIFPFMPPPGLEIAPLTTAEIRLPVSSTILEADPLAASGSWSRFTFDGDFIDKGSRIHTDNPLVLGSPFLETYALGFGYLLGNGAGVTSTSSLLPTDKSSGTLIAFTALFIFAQAPDEAGDSGTLLSVPANDSFPGMVIGVRDGFPYFKSGMTTILSNINVQAGVSRLAIHVAPTDGGAYVQFYLDEQPSGNGTFASTLFQTKPGACSVSGKGGYSAIFDELRIFDGAYPAFHLAEKAAKGKALISATGFEGGILGSGFKTEGDSIALAHGRLTLGNGSRLIIESNGIPPQGTSLTFNHLDGKMVASLKLADKKTLDIDTDGTIWIDGDATGFRVVTDAPSSLTVAIEPTEAGLLVYSSDDSWVLLDDTVPAIDATWSLSAIGEEPAVVSNVSLSLLKSALASSRRLHVLPSATSPSGPYTASSGIMHDVAMPASESQILPDTNQ